LYIPTYRNRPDFFAVDQLRFDYIALHIKDEATRQALAKSLTYSDLQKLYWAKSPPGCPGLSDKLYDGDLCLKTNIPEAQKLWKERKKDFPRLEFQYSKQGGDDHQRGMEWVQSEWKKNLGASVELRGLENKIYLQSLEKKAPDIFRKGIAPERPTCLSAIESFESSSAENYLKFRSSRFDEIIRKMRLSDDVLSKKRLCTEALKLLLDPAWIIPTGPIYFSLLVRPEWSGWKLNELNQLDLSGLKKK
jgi:oligopeptide transport system substrate-binding protein